MVLMDVMFLLVTSCLKAPSMVHPEHGRHFEDANSLAKVPDWHGAQNIVPSVSLTKPGGHALHASALVEPLTLLKYPIGHLVHVAIEVAPIMLEYVPKGHT